MKHFHVGVQMFSLREDLAKDFEGTLRKTKEIGYDYVEFAGYYGGKTGEEIRTLLDKIGLKSISVHQSIDTFLKKGQEAIDFFKAFGVKYIVIPAYDSSRLADSEHWEETKAAFKQVGELCRANGMELLYHNHDFELRPYGDSRVYDVMFAETIGFMNPQPDTCWLNYGGVDPCLYLRRYGERINVVHLKDFECTKLAAGPVYALIDENGNAIKKGSREDTGFRFMPLGQGRNDFKAILEACDEIDAENLIVEQDSFFDITPFEAVAASRAYLKTTFGI